MPVQTQKWTDPNRIAWIGLSLGAQRQLSFALNHTDRQPRVLVRISGGWVRELNQFTVRESTNQQWASFFKPSTLCVHAEHDQGFPVSDAQRLCAMLRTNDGIAELKILPGQSHVLEPNRLQVFRAVGFGGQGREDSVDP